MATDLREFLDAGPAPIVFTLGSSAVMLGREFYRVSFEIARRLGVRAVLLTGKDESIRPAKSHPDIFVTNYAPYSELFPHAAAVVHQGGVGTTGQVLAAGLPQLVVPFAHDQPDNAARIAALGVGRALPIGKYQLQRAYGELRRLMESWRYAERARALAELIRKEDGVENACRAILDFHELAVV
jgi:UDP:flavonoid glycosyltransferase YjiC (YdhE family)